MIFAVFDPSPLTVCINCRFFTFIFNKDRNKQGNHKYQTSTAVSKRTSHFFADNRLVQNLGPKCYAVQCIVAQWGRKPPNCPFPWDFVTPLEMDRAMAIGNVHKNW